MLPPDKLGLTPDSYVIKKPLKVLAGQAAPWFGQPGGGTQYLLPKRIEALIRKGIMGR